MSHAQFISVHVYDFLPCRHVILVFLLSQTLKIIANFPLLSLQIAEGRSATPLDANQPGSGVAEGRTRASRLDGAAYSGMCAQPAVSAEMRQERRSIMNH